VSERSDYLNKIARHANDDFNRAARGEEDARVQDVLYIASAARSLIGIFAVLRRLDALLDEHPEIVDELQEIVVRRIRL